jgi:hypothetical protein
MLLKAAGTRPEPAGGELVEIGLADEQRACGLQPGDDGRVDRRLIGVVRATGRRRHARDVDIVLHHEGQAPQRQGVRRRRAGDELGRGGSHSVCRHAADEDGGIGRAEPRQQRLDHVDRRHSIRIGGAQAGEIEEGWQRGHVGSKTATTSPARSWRPG